MADHKIGNPIRENITERVFIEADPTTEGARLSVAYRVLGDTVTILSIKVALD